MRSIFLTALVLVVGVIQARSILINEVQCAGLPGDRVELFNATSRSVDLQGMRLALGPIEHHISASVRISPMGFVTLWLDRHPEQGPDHIDLKLPREGGTLMLLGPDGVSIMDMFTYPALPEGVSIGRISDGSRQVGYFLEPSFGASNDGSKYSRQLLEAPTIQVMGLGDHNGSLIMILSPQDTQIRYSLDGSTPNEGAGIIYTGPVQVGAHGVIVARAFAQNTPPSDPTCMHMASIGRSKVPTVYVTADPGDLWGPHGIDTHGDSANFSRLGASWERPAQVQFAGDRTSVIAKIRVAGSGSRSAPKRSFILKAGSGGRVMSGPDAMAYSAVMLRADAGPNAFLRNLFMEHVAKTGGAALEIQPSQPMKCWLNGQDRGLYRAMPVKNASWLKTISGAETIELLDGPGATVLQGGRDHFTRSLDAIRRGAPIDTLEALIDVNSLLDLACFDLYSGRVDHDLNMRCWRPRQPGGRWRWVLFDMDFWAPLNENSVERMAADSGREAPFVPWLVAHAPLRDRLLARLSAWLNTGLAPDQARSTIRSIFTAWHALMEEDHQRWGSVCDLPTPTQSRDELEGFIREIYLEGLRLSDEHERLTVFTDVPLRFKAVPAEGFEFVGWKGMEGRSDAIEITPRNTRSLMAVFREKDLSSRHGL